MAVVACEDIIFVAYLKNYVLTMIKTTFNFFFEVRERVFLFPIEGRVSKVETFFSVHLDVAYLRCCLLLFVSTFDSTLFDGVKNANSRAWSSLSKNNYLYLFLMFVTHSNHCRF